MFASCTVCTFVHIVEVEVCNVQMVCWHSRVLAWRTVSTLVHSVQMIESEIIILCCACTGMCAMHIVHKLVCSLCAVCGEQGRVPNVQQSSPRSQREAERRQHVEGTNT